MYADQKGVMATNGCHMAYLDLSEMRRVPNNRCIVLAAYFIGKGLTGQMSAFFAISNRRIYCLDHLVVLAS